MGEDEEDEEEGEEEEYNTGALECRGGAGEEELVLHVRGLAALGDARLDVVRLHPLAQPLHRAVAVEGVGAERPGEEEE